MKNFICIACPIPCRAITPDTQPTDCLFSKFEPNWIEEGGEGGEGKQVKRYICNGCGGDPTRRVAYSIDSVCMRHDNKYKETLQRVGKEHYADGSIGAVTSTLTRKTILAKAEAAVCGERQMQYGDPKVCLQRVASLWNAYLDGNGHIVLTASDVAQMMALFKIGRSIGNRTLEDNYVDQAGYSAIAGEIA